MDRRKIMENALALGRHVFRNPSPQSIAALKLFCLENNVFIGRGARGVITVVPLTADARESIVRGRETLARELLALRAEGNEPAYKARIRQEGFKISPEGNLVRSYGKKFNLTKPITNRRMLR
ncbi:MAG: hypothetical protein V1494_02065 [Candidatus Diapherotrites archaeon]